jgi:hypothetical protein
LGLSPDFLFLGVLFVRGSDPNYEVGRSKAIAESAVAAQPACIASVHSVGLKSQQDKARRVRCRAGPTGIVGQPDLP